MKYIAFFLAAIFVLAIPSVSQGQEPANPDSALQAILNGIQGTPLSLQQAVQIGLKNATSVRKAEAEYLAASGAERREAGAFDPQLYFNLNYLDQNQPTASFFSGAPVLATQQTNTQSGLRLNLPTGTQLDLALTTLSLHTNSTLAFLNPEYDLSGSLNIRQPLLGGFWVSARKQLTQAERTSEAGKARFDQQVVSATADIERSYWDLYAAERNYAVQKLTRDRADAFLNETSVRAESGLVGPDQVANAKTFLAQQQLQLLDRSEELDRQSDALASLIGQRPEAENVRFIPTDEPPRDISADSVQILVERAVSNNLDLQAAQKDVEAAEALASAAGWEALPTVNLVGSLGGAGLAGTGQEVIILNDTLPVAQSRNFNEGVTQVTKRDFPNWSIGVEVSFPIGFRAGLGEKDRLNAQVLEAQQNYVEKSRSLEEQVRSAYRELVHGKSRLEAARDGVDAAQDQVRIGMIEFRNGRSTAFELVRLGEDLAVAEQRYSEALVRTAKAAATLKQLTSGVYSFSGNH